MLYEREFIPNYSPLPLIVYDFQVLAHDIHKYLESYDYITNSDPRLFTKLIKAAWAYRLNFGIDTLEKSLEKFTGVVVNDNKGPVSQNCSNLEIGYWRHIVAQELGLPEYKLGRGCKPDTFSLVCQIGLAYIHSPNSTFYYCDCKYMEADDLAGKLARIKRNSPESSVAGARQMLLYTIDGDWQGLVSDEHKIVWCNVGPWLPRMRNDAGVIDYYYRKLGVTIEKSRHCYDVKSRFGDAGDGLHPGSPLRLFDLYNEDHEYNFSESTTTYLQNVLNSMKNSKKIEHLQGSSEFFRKFGLIPPILGYPTQEEFESYEDRAKIERQSSKFKGVSPAIRKSCKELDEIDPQLTEKCINLGKQDDEVRKTLKEQEQVLEKCVQTDYECKKTARELIANLKNLRKKLKSEVENLNQEQITS